MPSIELIGGVGEGRQNGGAISVKAKMENVAKKLCAMAAQHLASCVSKDTMLILRCVARPQMTTSCTAASCSPTLPVHRRPMDSGFESLAFDDLFLLYQEQYE